MISNLMAILLQALSARLGIASGRDLAQACRDSYSRPVTIVLWLLCEVAIAACDLAEVIGAAITAGNAPCLVFNTSPALSTTTVSATPPGERVGLILVGTPAFSRMSFMATVTNPCMVTVTV
jgi:hypothetical protein